MATLHMRPLLPNLEDLWWYYGRITKEVESLMLQYMYLFFSPKLTTLSVALKHTFDGAYPPSILSGLLKSCPALNLSFLFQSPNSNEANLRGISSVISQWNWLQSLTVMDLTQEALEHLATFPFLKTLSFDALKGATRSYDQYLPVVTRNATRGFPALQS